MSRTPRKAGVQCGVRVRVVALQSHYRNTAMALCGPQHLANQHEVGLLVGIFLNRSVQKRGSF